MSATKWTPEAIAKRARIRQQLAERRIKIEQVIILTKKQNSSSVDCFNCENHLVCFGFRPNFGQFYTCDGFQFEKND